MTEENKDKKTTEELHPSNPNHPDYDVLRDPRVKSKMKDMENHVGNLARKHEEELKTMKETLEGLQKEKQSKEDADKSDLQKAQDSILAKDKEIETFTNTIKSNDERFQTTLRQRDAELLTTNSLLTAGVVIDDYQRRGLVSEVVEKLTKEKEGDSAKIVGEVVKTFLEQVKAIKKDGFKPVKIPGVTPKGNEKVQDLNTRQKELLKDPIKNRAELIAIEKQKQGSNK